MTDTSKGEWLTRKQVKWVKDFAQGILSLGVALFAMYTFSNVPHSNMRTVAGHTTGDQCEVLKMHHITH